VSRETVRKWRSRFVRDRLEGLTDEPRPGAPRKITDEQVEQVITATLEQKPPNNDTHWSTRSMATATGMSQSAISRIWRAFGLKPHLVETWKLSTDPQFIDKVRGHCCIEPKDVIATVQTSKVGSTIPVGKHDKPGIRALLEGIWRADETSSSGLIGQCNSAVVRYPRSFRIVAMAREPSRSVV
jgi:transposase-like protein